MKEKFIYSSLQVIKKRPGLGSLVREETDEFFKIGDDKGALSGRRSHFHFASSAET